MLLPNRRHIIERYEYDIVRYVTGTTTVMLKTMTCCYGYWRQPLVTAITLTTRHQSRRLAMVCCCIGIVSSHVKR